MTRNRKIFAAVFIVVSLAGMWARYQNDKAEKRKREDMLRSLANMTRESESRRLQPAPEEIVREPRDMFASALPQEYLEQIKQTAGPDAKLLAVRLSEMGLSAQVSTDGQAVKEYRRWKTGKTPEGPFEVNLIGDGKVADNLINPADVDLTLVPRMAKEALERGALADSKVDGASLDYPFFRNKGDGPEWTLSLSAKRGEEWEFKHVVFDRRGKFQKVY